MRHNYEVIPDDKNRFVAERLSLEVESEPKSYHNGKMLSRSTLSIILFILAVSTILAIFFMVRVGDTTLFDVYIPSARMLHLYSVKNGNYFTFNHVSQSGTFHFSFPRLHGSSITVDTLSNNCQVIQTSDGKWISYDEATGFKYGADNPDKAALFSFIKSSDHHHTNMIYMKICNRPIWVTLKHDVLSTVHIYPSFQDSYLALLGYRINTSQYLSTVTAFELQPQPYYRGVNLGGWFIPEVWMRRSFFNGTGLGWGGSLCGIVRYDSVLAEERMKLSLETWIVEQDFQRIAAAGFDSIRLPIGYWNIIADPILSYAPANLTTSIYYIELAYQWASKYGLKVLLDLHGMPGSQNGIDHSGCAMNPAWLENPSHMSLSLQAIDALAKRYAYHPQTIGIELVNEPGYYYSIHNHTAVLSFYQQAYKIIRHYHPSIMIVFNELYEDVYDLWRNELREPDYYNVVMDLHLYNWQEPYTSHTIAQHIEDAKKWQAVIEQQRYHHPIMIGEWSMSTGTFVQAGQPFVNAALSSFRSGGSIGWFLWNWKIESGYGFDEWDVSLQTYKIDGLNPTLPVI